MMKNKEVVPCLAEVYFPQRHLYLTYFNDAFPLKVGDMVYVEGKMEGLPGRVEKVVYNFKIRLSDYKRVTALVDTRVEGQLYLAGSSIITLEDDVLPYEKVRNWFLPPVSEGEETLRSIADEGDFISLEDLKKKVPAVIWERGEEYFEEESVVYAELNGDQLRAIVMGTRPYEVECEYVDGEVRSLLCDCFCTGFCKHQVAALLQLKETMKAVAEEYGDDYVPDYLALMPKSLFYEFVIANRKSAGIKLD